MPEDLGYDSPAIASWMGLFRFVARYPKVLLLIVFVKSISLLGVWIDHYLFFNLSMYRNGLYVPFPSSPPLASMLPSTPFLTLVNPHPSLYQQLNLNFEFAFTIIAYLLAAASFPILVSQGFENEKIELSHVFREGVRQIPKVLLYLFAMIGLAILLRGIGGLIITLSFPKSVILGLIAGGIYLLIAAYVVLRFYLVLPVLILERTSHGDKMGVKEAFTLGIEYTRGNVMSILGGSILLVITILLPLNIIHFCITPHVITHFWTPYWHFWTPYWPNWVQLVLQMTVWEIAMGIFGVFSAILPSIYYYAQIRKKKM